MRKFLFLGLIAFSALILLIFLKEGKQDQQSLTPVVDVGNKTIRDITETATAPIDVPSDKEIEIGRKILTYFPTLPNENPQAQYVNTIGKRLAAFAIRKDIQYTFQVMDSTTVNAFAVPGGFLLVTTGMLGMADEDALAWVIGHEISHVENRHALVWLRLELAKQQLGRNGLPPLDDLARLIEGLLRRGYSETMEMEADRGGIRLVMQADFNPKAALKLIAEMEGKSAAADRRTSRNPFYIGVKLSGDTLKSYFGTHPAWERRRQIILEEIRK